MSVVILVAESGVEASALISVSYPLQKLGIAHAVFGFGYCSAAYAIQHKLMPNFILKG